MTLVTYGTGTPDDPWKLTTPPGKSEFAAWREEAADPPALVVQVGSTRLSYRLDGIAAAHAMLKAHGDWMELGNADEGKPTQPGTLEDWARSPDNPAGGYFGLRKGYRGRFANHVAPVMEALGLVELEHKPKGNRIRAV